MLKILLSGCNGRMGRVISEIASGSEDITVVAGIDISREEHYSYPVYLSPFDYEGPVDVLVDFSNPAALRQLLDYCLEKKMPAVLATTGYTKEQIDLIEQASSRIPVFRSPNMSVGVCLITELARQAAALLSPDFDIEITERHHNRKIDAPSGTAAYIADAVAEVLPYQAEYVYGRHSANKRRDVHEIGIHSLRGGTIVGDHEVLFAGNDELIEIRHTAQSRSIFANGAVRAAKFIVEQDPGLYSMRDLVNKTLNPSK
jgi:4-hydroxy-tetrahydrodipicolinate reductase